MVAALNINANPNLLADPGFESGTPVPSAIGGWDTVVDAAFSQTYSHSGSWSMENYYAAGGFHGVSVQEVAVTPGANYDLSGWAFTPSTLSSSALGMFILFFTDANGALIGQYLGSPALNNTSPVNTWTQLSVNGTAPANAAAVYAETSLWDPGAGDAVYFDDVNLAVVPEPSVVALLSTGLGMVLLGGKRMK
jgi:hypothetical protein